MEDRDSEEVVKLYSEELKTVTEIGKILHRSPASISKILKFNGIVVSPRSRKDLRFFDKSQFQQIIDKYTTNSKIVSLTDLAKEYGCSRDTVRRVLVENSIPIRNEGARKWGINHDAFSEISTSEQAYWLGWMFSDGCNNPEINRVTIDLQARDIEVLENFKAFLGAENPISTYAPRTEKHQALCRLCVSSEKLSKDLEKWGVPKNKTFIIKWPTFLRKDLIRPFLLGLLEGDGTISGISCAMLGTLDLIKGITNFLETELGMEGIRIKEIHPERNKGIYSLSFGGRYRCLTFLDWLYEGVEIKLNRKYQKYLEIKNFVSDSPRLVYNDGQPFSKEDKAKRQAFKTEVRKSKGEFIIPIPVYEKPHSIPHFQYNEKFDQAARSQN